MGWTPRRWTLATGFAIAVELSIFFSGSTHNFATAHFGQQADAFLHGQAHMLAPPDPGLLGLPDPYNPRANRRYQTWDNHDMSLFQGRLYLYYGPLDSLLLVPLYALGLGPIPDAYLALAGGIGFAVVIAQVFRRMATRLAPGVEPVFLAGYLACVMNAGLVACLKRPFFYEAAIMTASFCLAMGAWLTLKVFTSPISSTRTLRFNLALVGLFLGASIAARNSMVPAVSVLLGCCLVMAWQLRPHANPALPARAWLIDALCLLAPVASAAAALAVFNYARFGSAFETGMSYQLASIDYRGALKTGGLFQLKYLGPMAWSYSLQGVLVATQFPFVQLRPVLEFIDGLPVYRDVAGLVYLVGPLVGVAVVASVWPRLQAGTPPVREGREGLSALVAGFVSFASSGTTLALLLVFPGAELRYFQDFMPGMLLGSVLGLGALYSACELMCTGRTAVVLRILMVIALLWEVVFSINVGWSYPR